MSIESILSQLNSEDSKKISTNLDEWISQINTEFSNEFPETKIDAESEDIAIDHFVRVIKWWNSKKPILDSKNPIEILDLLKIRVIHSELKSLYKRIEESELDKDALFTKLT